MNLRPTVSLFSEFCIDDRLKEIFKVIFKGPVIVYRLGLREEGGGVRSLHVGDVGLAPVVSLAKTTSMKARLLFIFFVKKNIHTFSRNLILAMVLVILKK